MIFVIRNSNNFWKKLSFFLSKNRNKNQSLWTTVMSLKLLNGMFLIVIQNSLLHLYLYLSQIIILSHCFLFKEWISLWNSLNVSTIQQETRHWNKAVVEPLCLAFVEVEVGREGRCVSCVYVCCLVYMNSKHWRKRRILFGPKK